MSRRYSFADLNTNAKPRIAMKSRVFGSQTYAWECKGRTALGYGNTPKEAYRKWEKNWARRFRFYGTRETYAQDVLQRFGARKKEPVGIRCKRCGTEGLHWVELDTGWRLFTSADAIHQCSRTGANHG
ncbi:hypothetical protein [Comamonas antarctica]|uniref:hypothetical protein n=1 Tax=Comamonas antarctica TaxID=2743470 RepID=UPI0028E70CA8|nr:hypothetical protein [Comamonas antarctica]